LGRRYALRPSCLSFRLPSGLTPLLPLRVVDRPIPIIHFSSPTRPEVLRACILERLVIVSRLTPPDPVPSFKHRQGANHPCSIQPPPAWVAGRGVVVNQLFEWFANAFNWPHHIRRDF
jgi:hypothetical protein